MIRACHELYQRPVHAVDGELGKVFDLYFDDFSWRIRYLAVELGSAFAFRHLLLSPLALAEYDGIALAVHLTKQEIEHCSGNGGEKPVLLQEKDRIALPYTMTQGFLAPDMALPFVPPVNGEVLPNDNRWNRYLRSSRHVGTYALCTKEGRAGLASDFLIDDRSWTVTYLVFSTAVRADKALRLLAVKHIGSVESSTRCLSLELSRETVLRLPVFDRERQTNIPYEELLKALPPAR